MTMQYLQRTMFKTVAPAALNAGAKNLLGCFFLNLVKTGAFDFAP